MSSDPDNTGSDDPGGGEPGGIDQQEKKTRFVPRPDLAQPSPAAPDDAGAPAAGTVIGRTRLIGNQGQAESQAPAGGGADESAATMRMGSAKTELIRGHGVESEPVAGWVVVVKGPGRGGFRPVFVGMNSVGRDPSQRVGLNFGDEFDLARGPCLHHLRRGDALLLSAARRQIEPRAPGVGSGSHPYRAQAQRPHPHRQDHAAVRPLLRPRVLVD